MNPDQPQQVTTQNDNQPNVSPTGSPDNQPSGKKNLLLAIVAAVVLLGGVLFFVTQNKSDDNSKENTNSATNANQSENRDERLRLFTNETDGFSMYVPKDFVQAKDADGKLGNSFSTVDVANIAELSNDEIANASTLALLINEINDDTKNDSDYEFLAKTYLDPIDANPAEGVYGSSESTGATYSDVVNKKVTVSGKQARRVSFVITQADSATGVSASYQVEALQVVGDTKFYNILALGPKDSDLRELLNKSLDSFTLSKN